VEDHPSNVGDANKITCTRISLTKKTKKTLHNNQEATTIEDMGINISRIYVALEDQQEEHQSHIIEVEGKIFNKLIFILIDSRARHSYIYPKVVDKFHLKKSKLEK
jgi:hypothetical protein